MDPQTLLSPEAPAAPPRSPRAPLPSEAECGACRALPDLRDRIQDLGLTGDYMAFRERYQAWRRGDHQGARGEVGARGGFGYWYPSEDVWSWRRTLSYWIAVCFFEGSFFFTVSSFLGCYPKAWGPYQEMVTSFGYVFGKIHFVIGTYLMCIETINLQWTELKPGLQSNAVLSSPKITTRVSFPLPDRTTGLNVGVPKMALPPLDDFNDVDVDPCESNAEQPKLRFYYSPFRYRRALANLEHVGAGPWPYYASVVYFVGVLIFGAGLVAEFLPLPELWEYWLRNSFYTLGSLFFVTGGACECVENGVFDSLRCDAGWWGALLNFLGGVGFLVGSVLAFFHAPIASSFVFGVGSAIFTLGAGIVIVMWKDEQFGLTFLAALNNLGGPNGRPMILGPEQKIEEVHTFSKRGAAFVMIYCIAAAVSVYNFLTALVNIGDSPMLGVERAFNALLPCIFSHLLLGLNAAVVETPKRQPFHLLYISCRWLALFMIANGTADFVQTLLHARSLR